MALGEETRILLRDFIADAKDDSNKFRPAFDLLDGLYLHLDITMPNREKDQIVNLIDYFNHKIEDSTGEKKQKIENLFNILIMYFWQEEKIRKTLLKCLRDMWHVAQVWASYVRFSEQANKAINESKRRSVVKVTPETILSDDSNLQVKILSFFEAKCEGNKLPQDEQLTLQTIQETYLAETIELLAKIDDEFFLRVMSACNRKIELRNAIIYPQLIQHPLIRKRIFGLYLSHATNKKCSELFRPIYLNPDEIIAKLKNPRECDNDKFVKIMKACSEDAILHTFIITPIFLQDTFLIKRLFMIYLPSIIKREVVLYDDQADYIKYLKICNDETFFEIMKACNQSPVLQSLIICPSFFQQPIIRKRLLTFYLDMIIDTDRCDLFKDAHTKINELIATDDSYLNTLIELIAEKDNAYFTKVLEMLTRKNDRDNLLHTILTNRLICPAFFSHPEIIEKIKFEFSSIMKIKTPVQGTRVERTGSSTIAPVHPLNMLLSENHNFVYFTLVYAEELALISTQRDSVNPPLSHPIASPLLGSNANHTSPTTPIKKTGTLEPIEDQGITPLAKNVSASPGGVPSLPVALASPIKTASSDIINKFLKKALQSEVTHFDGVKQYLNWANSYSRFKKFLFWIFGSQKFKRWGWETPPRENFINLITSNFTKRSKHEKVTSHNSKDGKNKEREKNSGSVLRVTLVPLNGRLRAESTASATDQSLLAEDLHEKADDSLMGSGSPQTSPRQREEDLNEQKQSRCRVM